METPVQLLSKAVVEIKQLRSENKRIRPRLQMFDDMMALLNTEIARESRGQTIDIVWEMEQYLNSKA